MKRLLITATLVISSSVLFGQSTYLDIEKNAPCELFAQKSGYDWQQRLSQIDSLENKEVAIFEIKHKDNQIKRSYNGKVEIHGKNNGKPRTKGQATVITVVVEENGQKTAYFPLTNDKNYRIYLKSCLN